jgi:epoxyqueuosine reductase
VSIKKSLVIKLSKEFGFDLIGFSDASLLQNEIKNLKEWLNLNYHSGMDYMSRNFEKRKDVKLLLENAKSVISLGINYYNNSKFSEELDKGKVSRYAWGRDYHNVLWEKLDEFVEEIRKVDNKFEARSYVDTGPVMDKAWAVKSGIGWMGKHTNVISKELGSWFFIATIITNREFEKDFPMQDFCGTCSACLDACPTGAIVSDYVVDSNKCISYLTIENKADIPKQYKGKFDNWLFGCDICQDVCPWNIKFSKPAMDQGFQHTENKEFELIDIIRMDQKNFRTQFYESPILRAKLKGLKRNASFLLNDD